MNAQLHEHNPVEDPSGSGMETTSLGLTFSVQPHHLGSLKLECRAAIGSVYWQSFNERIPVAARYLTKELLQS